LEFFSEFIASKPKTIPIMGINRLIKVIKEGSMSPEVVKSFKNIL